MAVPRNAEWNSSREDFYLPDEVEFVLRSLGIEVQDETETHFISLCPYHGNTNSPAFVTDKTEGWSYCFNPSCAVGTEYRLTLDRLVQDLKHLDSRIAAKRYISINKGEAGSFADKFDSIKKKDTELKEFPSKAIEVMHNRLLESEPGMDYLHSRNFTDETIKHFKMGLTLKSAGPVYRASDMLVVPAYDHKSRPVGLVGRSLEGKIFKNYGAEQDGTGFHKSQIVWNLNRAREHSSTIVINEAVFDSASVHQAGYPNVGALLGGTLSKTQAELLSRNFTKVIIMTDNENEVNKGIIYPPYCRKCIKKGFDMCQGHKPGRDLGMKIVEALPRMQIAWAVYDDRHIYANDVKDANGMVEREIRQCIRGAISHFDYLEWTS